MIRRLVLCGSAFLGLCVAAPAAQAAFPGANGRIVYEDSLSSGFYTVNPDGSGRTQLLPDQGTRTDDAAYSPDGGRVVFSRGLNLYVASANSGGVRQLTNGSNNDQGAAFSPDGTRVVFTRVADGDLFVVGLDGDGLRNLTNDPVGQEYEPAWSPDGSRIAYGRGTSSGEGSIYVIGADGSGARSITPEQSPAPTCDPDHKSRSSEPSWSPDGSRIAFTGTSICVGGRKQYGTDIWLMNPDGGGKVNITANDLVSEYEPHWSPDGGRIAFLSDRDETEGPGDVYVMGADGSGTVKIAERETKGEDIDWGPAPPPAVRLAGVRVAKKTFARSKGTTLRFKLSRAARVTATVTRGKKRAKRVRVGGRAGKNRIARFGKGLRPGRYTVALVARPSSGAASRTVKLKFRVR